MRILQVIPFFAPVFGGSFSVAYHLSVELSKAGHQVTVATSDYHLNEESLQIAEQSGVVVRPFRSVVNAGMFIITPEMKRWLGAEIKDFDVVHLHNFRSYQNNVAHRYARKYKIPYILQAHGSVPKIGSGKRNIKKLYDRIWGFRLLEDACRLIAVTDIEAGQYKQMGVHRDRIAVIPNALDPEIVRKGPLVSRSRSSDNKEPVVLYLGRVEEAKRIDVLLRSFARVVKDVPSAKLVIAGPDVGYKNELLGIAESLSIADHVRFLDYVKDVTSIYRDAAVLVNPATTEIFGLVPFEAIMCGVPVIVADSSGCGEMIMKAKCGTPIDTLCEQALADAISQVLRHPETMTELIRNGQEYIMKNLTWDEIVKRFEADYRICIHDA